MRKTDLTFSGMPTVVDKTMPDHVIRFVPPPPEPSNVLDALQKVEEELYKLSGVSDVMMDLTRKSLHGQYAVKFVVDEGEMRALGPFPLWENEAG